MGTEVAAQCAGPSPCAYSTEVGREPGRGWPGIPTRLGTVVIGVEPGPQATSIPCHPQAAKWTCLSRMLGSWLWQPFWRPHPGQAQVISRSRFSSSLSSGRPWHPRWLPRHQRRIHLGMQSHRAIHPEPLPAHLGSFCLFPAPPWWQPVLCL